jgi:orotate phosphoribosyltransferase-like protein
LKKWFIAFYLELEHEKGVSSCQLAKDLGVHQETAWHMLKRIRWALQYDTIEKLQSDVEID